MVADKKGQIKNMYKKCYAKTVLQHRILKASKTDVNG